MNYMVREIEAVRAQGLVVLGWRTAEDGLHLKVRGQTDEVLPRCPRCSRTHWIVREQFLPGSARILLSCHNCGTKVSYLLEGATLPAP